MTPCTCRTPRPATDPRKAGTCVVCSRHVPDEWDTRHVTAFYDRLAQGTPGAKDPKTGDLSPSFADFRAQALAREEEGREKFQLRYLGRNNVEEALEEVADLGMYCALEMLRQEREGRGEEDIDLALTATQHAFRAFDMLRQWQAKRAGAP